MARTSFLWLGLGMLPIYQARFMIGLEGGERGLKAWNRKYISREYRKCTLETAHRTHFLPTNRRFNQLPSLAIDLFNYWPDLMMFVAPVLIRLCCWPSPSTYIIYCPFFERPRKHSHFISFCHSCNMRRKWIVMGEQDQTFAFLICSGPRSFFLVSMVCTSSDSFNRPWFHHADASSPVLAKVSRCSSPKYSRDYSLKQFCGKLIWSAYW